ncbi:hypothetical protein [Halobacillus ihumii]|uniref:hypothetical protein n=1 Tax=Halobacillus ihumii TaxID=2686092 RepID=UPI0013D36865|nr:hypothetical protein [Halobacillus ihumii]
MKVKFIEVKHDEIFVKDKKKIKVGDIVDLPKDRAESFIARGKAEKFKEQPKKKEGENKA